MTSVGFAILDSFTQCLDIKHSKYSEGKPLLSNRETHLLKRLYSWEIISFAKEKDVADELNISSERVRQIRKKALKKLRVTAKRRNTPILKILQIIDGYAVKEEHRHLHKTIVRIWLNELSEFPAFPIIRLLTELRLGKREDVKAAFQYLASWKKARSLEQRRRLADLRRKLRNEEKLKDELLQNVIWFNYVSKWAKNALQGKEPKRKVNHHEAYFSGEIFSQKCNRQVQHESGVELDFIKKLEANSVVVSYLEQPVTIFYVRNEIEYQYTPDFAILLEDGRCLIAEVKQSYADMMDARVHRRMEALIEYCEKHGFGLLLTNGRYSLNYLVNYPCTPGLEKELQNRLDERGGRTIFFKEHREILVGHNAKKIELLSLVLKNNWGFYPFPFRLTSKNSYSTFREKIINKLPVLDFSAKKRH